MRFEMEGRSVGVPPHKRVLGYEVWMDPLPRTTTGKLKRFEIERRVREHAETRDAGVAAPMKDADRAWLESDAVRPIVAIVERAAHGAHLRPDANLELDLGLDSMERVELLTELEQRVGADVPEDVAQQIFTLRELVDAIRGHGRGAASGDEGGSAWATILASDPAADPGLSGLLESRPFMTALLFAALRTLMGLARLGMRFEVKGREHLPARGPYLISPNHQSYLDSFVLVGVLPWHVFEQLFFVGASEYFQTRLTRWLARQANVVPVDPDASLVPAMQAGGFGLRHGKVLVLFPEGERSIDGTVKAFKKGAAILSEHLAAPIVPVALDGIFEIWPRNRPVNWSALLPWRRAHVVIRFGAPMGAAAPVGAGGVAVERSYEVVTAELRARVEAMWNEERNARTTAPRG
jgi:long-chain acyl-CoA synthetase